ncbi:M50 family metallopeptidase [Thermopolyspora sp. NPDC052614]|uniref:M50 family metallopeptidase n=1 Tax=Thermopolyspora sp. NPDC052614 TaxID=3155682 RepID=UPI00343C553A
MLHTLWKELTTVQDAPEVWVVVVSALVALFVVAYPTSWHVSRGLITIAHEGGHALAALLSRRRLSGIRLHSDTSGVTLTRGRPTGFGMIVTAAAGYVAPSLLGLGGALLTSAGYIRILLWTTLVLLAAMLLMIRNVYGALSLLVVGGAVFALSWFTPDEVQGVVAHLAVWFLLFGGIRPIFELQSKRRRGSAANSDADQLAYLTRIPGTAWVGFFLLVSAAALGYGAYIMIPADLLPLDLLTSR